MFFFLVVFALSQAFGDRLGARKNLLLASSYYFYMCWDWRFAGLIPLATMVNYLAGYGIARAQPAESTRAGAPAPVGSGGILSIEAIS